MGKFEKVLLMPFFTFSLLLLCSNNAFAWTPGKYCHMGVDGFETVNQLDGKNDPTLYEWEAAGLKNIGMAWNRTLTPMGGQFRWSDIQLNRGAPYNWEITDAFVKKAQAQGIQILALIHPYVSWDQTDKTDYNYGKPHDMDAFKAWVTAIVERYDGDGVSDMPGLLYPITYYEIGNEPEGVHFNGSYPDNYQGFMETVKAARDAARASSTEVKIVIGGTSPIYDNTIDGFNSDVDIFWNNALGVMDATDCFDIFNFHFFVGEYTKDIKDYVEFWKTKLSTYGLSGKPMWLTETGTYSGAVTLSEGAVWPEQSATYQAAWLVKHYAYALANGVNKLFWVFYYSDQTDWRSHVAMVNIDETTKKPVYYSHQQMAEKIDSFSSAAQNAYDSSGGQNKTSGNIQFVVDNATVYILWNDQGGTVTLSGISSSSVKITASVPNLDANGNVILDSSGNPTFETSETAVSKGRVNISVSSIPVYVTLVGASPKPVLSITPATKQVSNDSGTTTFAVSNAGTGTMSWTAAVTTGGTWLRINSGSSGTDSGTITCGYDANSGTESRTGTIRVTAAGASGSPIDVTLTQSQKAVPVGNEPGQVNVTVAPEERVELMVNSTNSHGDTPISEWLILMAVTNGINLPIYVLSDNGIFLLDEVMVNLDKYTFSFEADGITSLGTLCMQDLGLKSGDSFLYSYVYQNNKGFIYLDNIVSILVR
ncbi:BACON domain-containing protein [Desulfatirhabdium butyrativorans]|uniref:BACON domain-containing protein n=1 Tax=Desulfatirhabdium butyrativorans TaxID=340467 RepID=UPI00040A6C5A|nr:BACON domain-containing carbohydrate-binding protein [Desulfatirhabdium butyrativorans]